MAEQVLGLTEQIPGSNTRAQVPVCVFSALESGVFVVGSREVAGLGCISVQKFATYSELYGNAVFNRFAWAQKLSFLQLTDIGRNCG